MRFPASEELAGLLRFASHPREQTGGGRITLTLCQVEQVLGEGGLAFREDASQEARRVKRPSRQVAGEKAGEWELGDGAYWVTFNERVEIPRGAALFIQPHPRLMACGVWHPTVVVRDWAEQEEGILLVVSSRKVRLREGAPLSLVSLLREDGKA